MPRQRKQRGKPPEHRAQVTDITPVLRRSDPTFQAAIESFGEGAAADYEPLEWDASVIAAMTPLSTAQRAFVIAYAWRGSASFGKIGRSGAVAGVGANAASRWYQTDGVRAAINAVEQQTFMRMGIDADWHLRELLRLYTEAGEIPNANQRISQQAGLLDRIGLHKSVASKAADKHEHQHNVSYEAVQDGRARVLAARRAEQGTDRLQ